MNERVFERSASFAKQRQERLQDLRRSMEKEAFSRINEEKRKLRKEVGDPMKWMKDHQDLVQQRKLDQAKGISRSPSRPKETRPSWVIRQEKEMRECCFYPKTNPDPVVRPSTSLNDSQGGTTLVSLADRAMKWYHEKEKKISTSRTRKFSVQKTSQSPVMNERSRKIVDFYYEACEGYTPIQEKAKTWLSNRSKLVIENVAEQSARKPFINKTSEVILKRKMASQTKKVSNFDTDKQHNEQGESDGSESQALDDEEKGDSEPNDPDASCTSEQRRRQRDRQNRKFQVAIRELIYRDSQLLPVCHSVTFSHEGHRRDPVACGNKCQRHK